MNVLTFERSLEFFFIMMLYEIFYYFLCINHGILSLVLSFQINLLAARNERESVQIAMRPKISWGASSVAGIVQVFSGDLCSTSGDRLVPLGNYSDTVQCVIPVIFFL